MRRDIIESLGWRPSSCSCFGFHFGEECAKVLHAILTWYFCYMIVFWVTESKNYQNEEGCTRPFALLGITQCICTFIFQLCCYFERYYHRLLTQLAVERNVAGFRRTRLKAIAMLGSKLIAFCGCLELTVIGSVWCVKEWNCVNKLDEGSTAAITVAVWLLVSIVCCLLYAWKILTLQIFNGVPWDMILGNNNRPFVMDQVREQQIRSLTESEINAIQKSKLTSYDQLSWFSKVPLKPSGQITIEMTTITNNEPVSVEEEITVFDNPELKQDYVDSSKDTCTICLEAFEIGTWYKKLPKCQHSFHATCIDEWLSTRAACPVCREEVFIEEHVLESTLPIAGNNLERSAPIEILIHSDRSESDLHV